MNIANQEQVAPSPRHISEAEMKRYFIPSDEIVVILLIIAGVILLLIGLILQSVGLILAGLAAALIGGGIIVTPMVGSINPTDAEYDAWLKAQSDTLLRRAMRKLNIDRQTTKGYLQVHGFVLPGMRESYQYRPDELRWKRGKDGIIRFSVNVYTYFFLTDQSVIVFTGDVNALNQSAHHEKTQEYLYRDIVGVTTSDEQNVIGLHQYRVQRFSLRVSNGDTLNVSANASPVDARQNLPSFAISDSGIDKTVATLRRVVREAKQSDPQQESQQPSYQPEQEYGRTDSLPEDTRHITKQERTTKKSPWRKYVIVGVLVLIGTYALFPSQVQNILFPIEPSCTISGFEGNVLTLTVEAWDAQTVCNSILAKNTGTNYVLYQTAAPSNEPIVCVKTIPAQGNEYFERRAIVYSYDTNYGVEACLYLAAISIS